MNTLQSRLDKIEKANRGNQFKHEINKITRRGYRVINSSPFHFEKFIFNGNLHSIHMEREKFTNYIKSEGNAYYKILKNLFDKLYYDDYNLFNEFELEENNYSEISTDTLRLKRIIMETNDINDINKIPKINELIPVRYLKEKERRYQGIRLFVNIRENGYIDLYLIDLYHLGINAYNMKTQNYNLDRNYNSNKDCKICISKIADNYELKD